MGDVLAEIRDLALGGDAVAVGEDGAVVLVPGALPGERVELADLKRKGGVLRGRVKRLLRPSPDRVEPPCELAGVCGGCPWMHASAPAREARKAEFVREALRPTGWRGEVAFHASPRQMGWRRRARLSWKGPVLGYRRRRSRRLVDVTECGVLVEGLGSALREFRRVVQPRLRGEGEVLLSEGPVGVSVVVRPSAAGPEAFQACLALSELPGIGGVALEAPGAGAPAVWGDPRDGGEAVIGPPGGFSQANADVNAELVATVVGLAQTGGRRVLELYAGAGNLTVALAPDAAGYAAVESSRAAVEACRWNLERLGIDGVRVVAGDAAQPPRGRWDVVILDPPRSGAAEALPAIVKARPDRIVYVSCDPATLGRDAGRLDAEGYSVGEAHAFDMFPQTSHVEAVVMLEKR